MNKQTPLHLEYGVNAFADDIYKAYKPLRSTAHYPDPFCTELRRALAAYNGVSEDMILVASGSDELIDVYIRLHARRTPALKVAFSPPTYPQYEAYTKREQVERIFLPHDRASITAQLIKDMGGDPANTVVMLDSPANPSGEIISPAQFLDLLDTGFQVFVDEAYYEFHGVTMADYITKYPKQLVVSRSLSKFAAMSGSRVGYLIAHPDLVAEFRAWQLFFNVNSEGQQRALFALQNIDAFHAAVAEMRQTKQKIEKAIRRLAAYDLFPSLDMYLIFKHRDMPTQQLHQELQEKHQVITTRFPTFKDHDVIRSAVLKPDQMNQLVAALQVYANPVLPHKALKK